MTKQADTSFGESVAMEPQSVRLSSKLVSFGKMQIRVYSIGHLALALHRSCATIRRWQRAKIIPPPIVKTKDGARWYMREEIEAYSRLVKVGNIVTGVSIEETGFPTEAHAEIMAIRRKLEASIKTEKKA